MKCYLDFKEAVISTLAILQHALDDPLTQEDWQIIEKSIEILKPFLDVTNEVSAEKSVTVSKLIPLVKLMKKRIQKLQENYPSPPEEVERLLEKLKEELHNRFRALEENELISQATILDPRFKKYGFADEKNYKTAYDVLKRKVCTIKLDLPTTSEDSSGRADQTASASTITTTGKFTSLIILYFLFSVHK